MLFVRHKTSGGLSFGLTERWVGTLLYTPHREKEKYLFYIIIYQRFVIIIIMLKYREENNNSKMYSVRHNIILEVEQYI